MNLLLSRLFSNRASNTSFLQMSHVHADCQDGEGDAESFRNVPSYLNPYRHLTIHLSADLLDRQIVPEALRRCAVAVANRVIEWQHVRHGMFMGTCQDEATASWCSFTIELYISLPCADTCVIEFRSKSGHRIIALHLYRQLVEHIHSLVPVHEARSQQQQQQTELQTRLALSSSSITWSRCTLLFPNVCLHDASHQHVLLQTIQHLCCMASSKHIKCAREGALALISVIKSIATTTATTTTEVSSFLPPCTILTMERIAAALGASKDPQLMYCSRILFMQLAHHRKET